jgi:hypothetical protein
VIREIEMNEITTQAQADGYARELIDAGYPYVAGSTFRLMDDGNIRDEWINNEGELEFVERTQDELAESVYCYFHDC